MKILELVTRASASVQTLTTLPEHPIVLDPDSIVPALNPRSDEPNVPALPVPLTGWKISQSDSERVDLCKKFFASLAGKLKNPKQFGKEDFLGILSSFLENIAGMVGLLIGADSSSGDYTQVLVEKVGVFVGKDVSGLILEASVVFGIWDLVEVLVKNGLVGCSSYRTLIPVLVEKQKSDLLCQCVKYAADLQSPELLLILQHFLNLPEKNGSKVRKEWENQAVSAIEKASSKSVTAKKSKEAKDAAVLLMLAHDGFSSGELCLHYCLASANFADVVLCSAIIKLNGKEMTRLIRYLGKWLKKYERFPQAVPCPKASALLGLTLCDWVPRLEDVVKFLGLVIDESFFLLVLHPEFHGDLGFMETVVGSLVSEAKLCCSVANVAEKLKIEAQGT